jgi:hypothetical protein
MKKIALLCVLVVFLITFVVSCGGKTSLEGKVVGGTTSLEGRELAGTTSLEGKVVDGKGQPLARVKVVADLSQTIKGYDKSETTTGADGVFTFKELFPSSDYQLIFSSDRWTTEKKMKTNSGPERRTKMLPQPVMIRFMDFKEGVVSDTKTDLMWAVKDSGSPMNWASAKSYCENYRGGGYTGWRMPTQNELVGLYAGNAHKGSVKITRNLLWAAETSRYTAAFFNFSSGFRGFTSQEIAGDMRALPVRSGK